MLGKLPPEVLAAQLRDRGYRVSLTEADWCLDAQDGELQRAYLDGVATAVTERPTGGLDAERVSQWRAARSAAIDEGRSELMVGHLDLLARRPV